MRRGIKSTACVARQVCGKCQVWRQTKREKNGKWTFEAGFQPLNAQALKPVLSVVAAVIGEFGEGLVELSEKLGGQTNAEQDT